jgi:hypothetical protein
MGALLLFPGNAAFAQSEEQKQQMQQQLDDLQRQIDALNAKVKELQQQLAGTPAEAKPEATAAEDDLMKVEPLNNPSPPEASATTGTAEPSTTAAESSSGDLNTAPVENPSTTATSKVFNPDISVIGNFLGHAGDSNPNDPRDTFQLEEAELALEAFVDPFAKAKFFIGASPEGAEVEEGYVQFIALPFDLTATVGKKKALFGKVNTMHAHTLPWADTPLVMSTFFGGEGLNDSGVSVSKIFPNRFAYVEATGEVFRGKVDDVFEAQNANDLFYNTHVKLFKDISEQSNVELGGSYARGTALDGGNNEFSGLDVTYRWKPLQAATWRSFIARTELIQNRRSSNDDSAFGMYASADYQLARRWFTGLRFDSVDHPDDPSATDRGGAATLTFWPSEFSQLRGEFRHIRYADDLTANEFLLQVQFAIGAHGAHTF